jgi:CheY-like chemotaxis protein
MHRLETEQRMSSRILVINDDQSILELFQLLLESEGYEVLLSKVAFEEVSQIEQQHVHLIILDFKFGTHPEGFLLLQKIRMYPPTTAIPVILCTAAVGEVREQEEVLRQKGIPVIYKPFDLDELLQAIHQFLPASSLDRREDLV